MSLQKINNISSPEEINSIAYADIAKLGGIDVVHSFVASGSPVAWFSADSLGLSEDDPVSSWTDLTGNGNHLIAPSGKEPVIKEDIVNGLPSVFFNGGQFMEFSHTPMTQPLTVFMVFRHEAFEAVWYHSGNSVAGDRLDYTTNSNFALYSPPVPSYVATGFSTSPWPYTKLSIVSWNGASSNERQNGVQGSDIDAGTGAPAGLSIGAQWNGTAGFANLFYMCELIIYDGSENYLANEVGLAYKYGIVLP